MMVGFWLSQGVRLPEKASVQVFVGFWLLFCLVLTISYVSNLTAFMTVPALSPTLNNLNELSNSDFSWGIAKYGAADYQLLKTSKVSRKLEMYYCVADNIDHT